MHYKSVEGIPEKDIPSLCKKDVFDCAIVAVPDHLHFSYTKELLRNNIPCLVVKPFTPTLLEAKKLVALQKKKGLYGAVEFHKRFDESNLYVKKVIAEGKLGDLVYCTVDYSQRIQIPTRIFRNWVERTNIFQYLAVHYVDLIYFITGYLPIRATAVGTNGILKASGIKVYDSIHATVIWQKPASNKKTMVSVFSVNWIDPNCTSALSDQKYKFVGTKGRIECDQKNRGIELVLEDRGIKHVNPYFSEYLYDENGVLCFGGYAHKSISCFVKDINALKEKRISLGELENTRPTFSSASVSTAVIEAVNNSLKNNSQWYEITGISGE
jgi:predicted dehydrogenase